MNRPALTHIVIRRVVSLLGLVLVIASVAFALLRAG
jgi:hypothetical protein